ncbi:RNA-guided endonuclease TnpB family protein [Nocardia terpenica]|uniref:RNA-guided endonuclease TnpB family protein n=1 Tax=Nocardia terpenica TaxID=455432 RepID=UPI0018E085E0|nr:RNA-guided endonuclease TnpB family protein [Nocardia terpenica]
MTRHTCFRFCLDPTAEQQIALSRHTGAARLAFNQCLGAVKSALTARRSDPAVRVPWSGFDLINYFNTWKKAEDAGRFFAVDPIGVATVVVTGLAWRNLVCQQVFEEAAVDCGQALTAWTESRAGRRQGSRVGFPRFKRKSTSVQAFRIRTKQTAGGRPPIRVGDNAIARSITLPKIGTIRIREDTRRLRRMLASGRAKILFVTVTRRASRWQVAVNIEAADLHPAHRHPPRPASDPEGWVGIDRGLTAFTVAATSDGREVERVTDLPRAFAAGLRQQRRLARAVSRKRKGSAGRRRAVARLARHHHRVRNVRQHFLHQVSTRLVKTHDRLVLEDLNTAGMLRNRYLARAISDAGWAEFARMVGYKQSWRGGRVLLADRWFASSRICSRCGTRNPALTLADRIFTCGCGLRLDRDLNAAVNLAAWGETQYVSQAREPEARAPVSNVRRREGAGPRSGVGETGPNDAETSAHIISMA